ncbi:MAG: DUF3782 domain-containing protein [Candidatus Methanomethylicia archaeon]
MWREVLSLKVVIESMGRKWSLDLEKTVLEIYRYDLEERGIKPEKIEKFVYVDVDGRYYRRGLNWSWMYMCMMRKFTSWR